MPVVRFSPRDGEAINTRCFDFNTRPARFVPFRSMLLEHGFKTLGRNLLFIPKDLRKGSNCLAEQPMRFRRWCSRDSTGADSLLAVTSHVWVNKLPVPRRNGTVFSPALSFWFLLLEVNLRQHKAGGSIIVAGFVQLKSMCRLGASLYLRRLAAAPAYFSKTSLSLSVIE